MNFSKFNWWSIFSIFMLFVLGGLVRATGSGMGCPDWPKCFGAYIPPTSDESLPDNYEEIFKAERIKKLHRFSTLLQKLRLNEKATELRNYENLNEEHSFNVVKAYVEYINRLWGALTGIIVLLSLIASIQFIKTSTRVFIFSLLGFIAVFVNALLGAVVVNSNLFSGLVTVHFLAAFGAIAMFIIARFNYKKPQFSETSVSFFPWVLFMIIVVVQVVLGTQARTFVDSVTIETQLHHCMAEMGISFVFHRLLAIGLLGFYLWVLVKYKNTKDSFPFYKHVIVLCLLTIVQIIVGSTILFDYLIPYSKLIHITVGASIFVLHFYICSALYFTSFSSKKNDIEHST